MVQQPFQSGILVSIESVRSLLRELKSEDVSYILTSKVNQDALENHFSSVRFVGGSNSHPTAALFCDRIQMLCVSKNIELVLDKPSVEIDIRNEENLLSAELLNEIPGSNYEEPEGKSKVNIYIYS